MRKYLQFAVLAGLVAGLAGLPAVASAGQRGQGGRQNGGNPPGSGMTSNPGTQLQRDQEAWAGEQAPPNSLGQGSLADLIAAHGALPVNPKEQKAYKTCDKIPASNPQGVINKCDSFLESYPKSIFASSAYARLAFAYESTGDAGKMFNYGHKSLALNPNDVDVLSMMAYAIPRQFDPSNGSVPSQLQETSQHANRALGLLLKMQKPAGLTEDQFTIARNGDEAFCHSGLGLVDYYQHDIPGMVTELERAIKLETPAPDTTDEYMLGIAYMQDGRASDAVTTLQKCADTLGPVAIQCKSSLTEAQKLAASPPKQ